MSRKANRKKSQPQKIRPPAPPPVGRDSGQGRARTHPAPGRHPGAAGGPGRRSRALALPMPGDVPTAASRRVFVPARVTAVLSDNAGADDWSEGRRMGSQVLEVELLGGEHTGTRLTGTNYMSAYINIDAREGTRVILRLDYEEDGTPYIVSFVNYDRGLVLGGLVLVFAALLIIIGGKKGLMALLGLVFHAGSLPVVPAHSPHHAGRAAHTGGHRHRGPTATVSPAAPHRLYPQDPLRGPGLCGRRGRGGTLCGGHQDAHPAGRLQYVLRRRSLSSAPPTTA